MTGKGYYEPILYRFFHRDGYIVVLVITFVILKYARIMPDHLGRIFFGGRNFNLLPRYRMQPTRTMFIGYMDYRCSMDLPLLFEMH